MKESVNPSSDIVIALPLKGGVKQVRCPVLPSAAVGCFLLILGAISGWALVDYSRLVTLSLQHQDTIGELTARNQSLEQTVNGIEAHLTRMSYRVRAATTCERRGFLGRGEDDSKERAASQSTEEWVSWGDIGPWWLAGRSKARLAGGGVGGAEVDCSSAQGRCDVNRGKTTGAVQRGSGAVRDTSLHPVTLVIPVSGPVTSHFGVRTSPFTHGRRMHEGMDIDCRIGAPIQASGAGEVEFVGRHGTYGLVVDINHGGGLATRYAHLSGTTLKVGARVGRGTIIGRCGSSGRSTGPHLHFEIRENGVPVDPRRYLFIGKSIDRARSRGVQVAAQSRTSSGRDKSARKIG